MWLFSCSVTTASPAALMSTIFGLGVLGYDLGNPAEIDVSHGAAIDVAVADAEQDERTGGRLRDDPVIQLLVALVLDDHRERSLIGAERDRVGLTAHIAGARHRLRRKVDHGNLAGRMRLVLRSHHSNEGVAAQHRDGGWLTVERDEARGHGRSRIGDIHKTHRRLRRVRVDERHAVLGRRDDLRDRGRRRIAVRGQVRHDREAGDPVEGQFVLSSSRGAPKRCQGSNAARQSSGA